MSELLDLLVVGAGPTGLACAIEATRAGLNVLVIEKGCLVNSLFHYPAGMTFFTTRERLEIGDIPFASVNLKPTRAEALEYYRRAAEHYRVPVRYFERVLGVEGADGAFRVLTEARNGEGKGHATRKVVLATGYYDLPNLLGIPGEDLAKVSHYYSEAHEFFGLKVAVIGGANSAAIAMGYAALITSQFNQTLAGRTAPLTIRQKMLYNPEAESVYYMVPGIVAVLVTMVTVMLTSMAIVREREVGTLEQLMVTPISTPAFILGKTIPFAILGYLEMSIALVAGILWFHVPFAGSWALLYSLVFIFLFTTLGVGMFISTLCHTQQQAMFFAWFFSIFALMTSGFITPIGNMPHAVQYITYLNPLRYFMTIVRGIMMKGAGVDALYREILAMVAFSTIVFTSSWLRFSKRVK